MGEFTDYFKQKKNLLNLLVLGILVLALPLGIDLIRQQQILKSRAAVDPIVFTGANVQQKTDGTWVALQPQIALTLASPLGPAVQTQTVQSKNSILNVLSNLLVKDAYACSSQCVDASTCTGCNNVEDGGDPCPGDCGWMEYCCAAPPPPPPPSSNYCTAAGYHECTPGNPSGTCSKNGQTCTAYETYECNFGGKNYCGAPFSPNAQICDAPCSPTTCPAGTTQAPASQDGQRLSDNIVGSNLQSYTGTGQCGYAYYHWDPAKSVKLANGDGCFVVVFTPWADQTQCPTGACTVSNWTFSNNNPAPNTLIKATVKGVKDGTWSNIVYKKDSESWVTTNVTVTSGPTFSFDVNSGTAGTHTVTLGVDAGKVACTPTGSFTTGASPSPSSPGSTNCPADSNLTITPSTANVGDTMIFQYKAGEDVFIGGDTWSSGIDSNQCQFDLLGRKYTCTAKSAVDNGVWQHRWNKSANCGSATYTIKSGTTPSVTTVAFRVAENPTDFTEAGPNGWQLYTSHPMTGVNYEFKDKTPGLKTIFVQFKDSNKNVSCGPDKQYCAAQITLLGAGPEITGCGLTFEGNTTSLNLTGTGFGTTSGKVSSGTQDLQVGQWNDTNIQAVWPATIPENQTLNVTVANTFGQTVTGQCSAVAQLALGAKVFCRRPSDHTTDNVEMVLAGAFPEGTLTRQKVTIDKDGLVQGINQKLEAGKQYRISLKAPFGLRKAAAFTASAGTTNIPNFVLPIGDIFPIDGGDEKINSLDKSELNRQWTIAQAVTNRTGDFNRDTRVNSIDWACMRYDFNVPNDPEPTTGAPSQSASSGATTR